MFRVIFCLSFVYLSYMFRISFVEGSAKLWEKGGVDTHCEWVFFLFGEGCLKVWL